MVSTRRKSLFALRYFRRAPPLHRTGFVPWHKICTSAETEHHHETWVHKSGVLGSNPGWNYHLLWHVSWQQVGNCSNLSCDSTESGQPASSVDLTGESRFFISGSNIYMHLPLGNMNPKVGCWRTHHVFLWIFSWHISFQKVSSLWCRCWCTHHVELILMRI